MVNTRPQSARERRGCSQLQPGCVCIHFLLLLLTGPTLVHSLAVAVITGRTTRRADDQHRPQTTARPKSASSSSKADNLRPKSASSSSRPKANNLRTRRVQSANATSSAARQTWVKDDPDAEGSQMCDIFTPHSHTLSARDDVESEFGFYRWNR